MLSLRLCQTITSSFGAQMRLRWDAKRGSYCLTEPYYIGIETKIMRFYILLLLAIFMLEGCQSGFYQGPPSDHFNGVTFFNPGETQRRSIEDVFEQGIAIKQQPWPSKFSAEQDASIHQIHSSSNAIKITFINHSTVLIQTKKINILTDPIWSYRASPFSWIGPARMREPGIKFSELPPIHVVLISHNHYDHLDIPTLERLNKTFHPVFIVPLGNKNFLNGYKIYNVTELDWWQKFKINNTTITFLPSQHWSTRWLTDINRTLWGSYGIDSDGEKIYFAGDTGYSTNFKIIRSKWGEPDLSLLPIGAYEPRSLLQSVHLNPQDAIQAHNDLNSHYSMGIHFGTFQLSRESIEQPIKDLTIARQRTHVSDDKFFILHEGENWFFPP